MWLTDLNGPKWPKRGRKRHENASNWTKAQGSPLSMHTYLILAQTHLIYSLLQQTKKRAEKEEKGEKKGKERKGREGREEGNLVQASFLSVQARDSHPL